MLSGMNINLEMFKGAFGLGVAGNFAGHLEQAGEDSDFKNVAAEGSMPKGIFPWYVPGSATFLGAFPLSSNALAIPASANLDKPRIQIEPEVGVYCDVTRSPEGEVVDLHPRWVAAFDDCSHRRPGANKISEKKNWGRDSKGVAATVIPIESIERSGPLGAMRLSCWLRRGGEVHAYGVDSEVASYTLFGDALIEWLVDRLNNQRESVSTPLEDVGALLRKSGADSVLIGIGATRYEPYGESTFVEEGDDAVVVLYDSAFHPPELVEDCVSRGVEHELLGASVLTRKAYRLPLHYSVNPAE